MVDGRALIDIAAATLARHVDALVLCGRRRPGWTTLDDVPTAGLGPLGGVAAALRHGERHGFDGVVTIGCDMPDVPDALIAALIEAAPAYCRDAPILACWPASLAAALVAHLERDARRSIRGFGDRIGATALPAPQPLANINTPADLAALVP
jgi:molybdopterin-guanine dinucleotide biosynthesis protein A